MASSYILSSHPRRFSLQFSNTSNICSILKFSDIGISNRTRRRWEKRLLVDCWSLSHKGHTHTCSRPDTTTTTDSHLSLFYFPPFSKWVVLYKYITEEPKLWGVELWRSIWKSRAAATKTRSSWCRTPNEYLLRMFGAWARLLLRVLHTSPSLQRTPQSKFSHHRLKTSGSIFRVKSQTTKQKRRLYLVYTTTKKKSLQKGKLALITAEYNWLFLGFIRNLSMAPEDIFFILEDGFLLKKIHASVFSGEIDV